MNKFIKQLLITGVTVGLFCTTALAAENGVVSADRVNVRKDASLQAQVLTVAEKGSNVLITGEESDWYAVTYNGLTGFMYKDYISISKNEAIPETSGDGDNIVSFAKNYLGTPYLYGGNTPDGFDCSGFVQYVMKNLGYTLPRTSTEQYSIGTRIEKSQLLPGDLVFFKQSTSSSRLSHVGIYVGDGKFIHSPYTGQSIKIDSLSTSYFANYYYGATRVSK